MMRLHRRKMMNSSILKRMLLFTILGVIVPILIFNMILFFYNYKVLKEQTIQSYEYLNTQIVINLDNIISGVAKYTSYPYYNSDFQEFLSKDYTSGAPGFKDITRDSRLFRTYVRGQIIRYNSHIRSAILYNATSNTSFIADDNYTEGIRENILAELLDLQYGDSKKNSIRLYSDPSDPASIPVVLLARPLYDPSTRVYKGYFGLVMDVNEFDQIFDLSEEAIGVQRYVVDENGIVVISHDNSQIGLPAPPEVQAFLSDSIDYAELTLEGKNMTAISRRSKITQWTVVNMVDTNVLFCNVRQQQKRMTGIIMTLFCVALLAAVVMAFSISKPIQQLKSTISKIVDGKFDTRVQISSSDEVGQLAVSFNRMLDEIQIYQKKLIQREKEKQVAEFNSLQSQINPHFLYNTLNTIKWMANMQCAVNIADATDSLIYLLRYASSTNKFVSVAEEYAFIQKYISLMQLRYYDSFDLEYDFQEEILLFQSLRLMLQPFIENAIFHGFQNCTGRKVLSISCKQQKNALVFHVKDNGVGMDYAHVQKIMSGAIQKEHGFNSIGIHNVIERIHLNYGYEYGVTITSEIDKGTDVQVTIPALETKSDVHKY
ncbi:sensor histidine kinase [Oscillospiraceae bacterium PP1C4]